jgi:hypothetical protein
MVAALKTCKRVTKIWADAIERENHWRGLIGMGMLLDLGSVEGLKSPLRSALRADRRAIRQ